MVATLSIRHVAARKEEQHVCVPRVDQTAGTERILYGLDDVKSSAEIIVVEGEMDKLALEEAGIRNVVSVPDGAPQRVKDGDLPPPEADTKFQFLWNCRAVLDQAVRIVLATDSDVPGQVPTPLRHLSPALQRSPSMPACYNKHILQSARRSGNAWLILCRLVSHRSG